MRGEFVELEVLMGVVKRPHGETLGTKSFGASQVRSPASAEVLRTAEGDEVPEESGKRILAR